MNLFRFVELSYLGTSAQRYYFLFNGQQIPLGRQFYDLFERDPQAAEEALIKSINLQKFPGQDYQNREAALAATQQTFKPSNGGNRGGSSGQSSSYEPLQGSHQTPLNPDFTYTGNVNQQKPSSNRVSESSSRRTTTRPTEETTRRRDQGIRDREQEEDRYDGAYGGGYDDSYHGGFGSQPSTGFSKPIPKDREQIGADQGYAPVVSFALDLFKASSSDANFVLSPLSPQILLTHLTWTADGNTYNELLRACGYGSPVPMQKLTRSLLSSGGDKELQIATAFFHAPDMNINEEFLRKSVSSADVIPVDFKNPSEAGKAITKWSTAKTKGQLKLNEISFAPSTKLAMQSALYFKGKFIFNFETAKPGDFFVQPGAPPVKAQIMQLNKKKFRWGEIKDGNGAIFAEWAAIPYMSEDSLVIILPNEDINIDLAIKLLDQTNMDVILDGLDREKTKANMNITMPKFKLQSTVNLVEPLKKVSKTSWKWSFS